MVKKRKKITRRPVANATIRQELDDILAALDQILSFSEQSASRNLAKAYELIDQAKQGIVTLKQAPVAPAQGHTNTVVDVDRAMGDAISQAKMQVEQASNVNQNAQALLEGQAMEMPEHLQEAMLAVQESINTTAAALQHGIEHKNKALEEMMALQITSSPESTTSAASMSGQHAKK